MSLHVVRLGSPRLPGEGLRIGTVRRPPRGVPRSEFASRDWYDVWFPNLAPSATLMKRGRAAESDEEWRAFEKAFRREMAGDAARHDLELLARLSHRADFSVGCYCEREDRCHRSILRRLLADLGADIK